MRPTTRSGQVDLWFVEATRHGSTSLVGGEHDARLFAAAPDLVTLAESIAAERDTAEAEVELLRAQVQILLTVASEWSARFDLELGRMSTRLAEVEAERDLALRAQVAWCPDCGEVETCDEDGACSCGRAIIVFADRYSYEMALEHIATVTDERDRLHEALARWGRWCHSPDSMGGDLFDAAVEGTPDDCFPAEVSDAG